MAEDQKTSPPKQLPTLRVVDRRHSSPDSPKGQLDGVVGKAVLREAEKLLPKSPGPKKPNDGDFVEFLRSAIETKLQHYLEPVVKNLLDQRRKDVEGIFEALKGESQEVRAMLASANMAVLNAQASAIVLMRILAEAKVTSLEKIQALMKEFGELKDPTDPKQVGSYILGHSQEVNDAGTNRHAEGRGGPEGENAGPDPQTQPPVQCEGAQRRDGGEDVPRGSEAKLPTLPADDGGHKP